MVTIRSLCTSAIVLASALVSAIPTPPSDINPATSTSPTSASPSPTGPLCQPEEQGIVLPKNGATIIQIDDGEDGNSYFEVVYCSGQYFKTSSIDASVLLSQDGITGGELLIKDQKPDDKDAITGFSSYRFNVTLSPEDGDYLAGERILSVYETETGYYDVMNYAISSINITLAVTKAST